MRARHAATRARARREAQREAQSTHGVDGALQDVPELTKLLRLTLGLSDARGAPTRSNRVELHLHIVASLLRASELVSRTLGFGDVAPHLSFRTAQLRFCFALRRLGDDFRRAQSLVLSFALLECSLL